MPPSQPQPMPPCQPQPVPPSQPQPFRPTGARAPARGSWRAAALGVVLVLTAASPRAAAAGPSPGPMGVAAATAGAQPVRAADLGARRGATGVSAPAQLAPSDDPGWRIPLWPTRVTRPFGNPPQDWLPGHRGVDLRGVPGQPVRAAGTGRVTFAATLAGRGVVVVDHGELRTTYEPVEALVLPGQRVRRGAVLGVLAPGAGHCGTGLCLHLGLKRGRTYLDPLLLFGSPRALLRPW